MANNKHLKNFVTWYRHEILFSCNSLYQSAFTTEEKNKMPWHHPSNPTSWCRWCHQKALSSKNNLELKLLVKPLAPYRHREYILFLPQNATLKWVQHFACVYKFHQAFTPLGSDQMPFCRHKCLVYKQNFHHTPDWNPTSYTWVLLLFKIF